MRIPVATYRLQFNSSFGFKAAGEVVDYLRKLGVSDIYASPVFMSRAGSTHGYDVVDPNTLDPKLGSEEDFEALSSRLNSLGMGWLQDIVPNHMAYDSGNQMLMDLLENGSCSEYYGFFDIEWDHPYESIKGRILAPFLGRPYGETLEDGEIKLRYDCDGFSINYYELRLPLKIESYTTILTYRLGALRRALGEDNPDYIKLLGILYSIKNLPSSREEFFQRYNQIRFIKRMIWELFNTSPEIKGFVEENIGIYNGKKGSPDSFNMLDGLLSEQFFRLSFWKVATEELNYRRFFNINGLISLRMEDEHVFNHCHSLILDLVRRGIFSGLRVDHVDGLLNPTGYLNLLRERAPDAYIVVEKILDMKEDMPSFWPVQGSTGYDFLNYLNGVFVDYGNERGFSRAYYGFTGLKASYESILYREKRLIIEKDITGDVDNLANLLKGISSRDRHGSDITLYGLKRAIIEVIATFPVYRTYISPGIFRPVDHAYIKEAVIRARKMNPVLYHELNFIERFLQIRSMDNLPEEERDAVVYFVMRFQQLTGPLMAKGFEDTTLYVYNRLLSLNEVGGSPERFGIPLEDFHTFNRKRAEQWPFTMNATSTHDTKRGEDVRARLNVLSEIPLEWEVSIKRWSRMNQKSKRRLNGIAVPDKNDEYLLYQTLIGSMPFNQELSEGYIKRIKGYILKAVREAKVHTAWLKPDTDYEEAFISFIDVILRPSEGNRFLKEFLQFQRMISHYGIFNSLSQALLKITSPGLPDFYQGTELWDLNLVDPDNRRLVDFGVRMEFLWEIMEREKTDAGTFLNEMMSYMGDGRIKLFLIYKALKARNELSDIFLKGGYLPLGVEGKYRRHIISYARNLENGWTITVAPRLLTSLIGEEEHPLGKEVWEDTHIILPAASPSVWQNAITSERVEGGNILPVGEVLKSFPVALLLG